MKKTTATLISIGTACAVMLVGYGMLRLVTYSHTVQYKNAICQTNLISIAKAMIVYANDDPNGRLPPVDKWCDLLVGLDFTSPKQFVCRSSDAVIGESSFAINKHIAGMSLTDIPKDIVLLFETDHGKDPNGRNELFRNRQFSDKMPSYATVVTKVFKGRWNQTGGPELLTFENHGGRGCCVVFVDASVKFVTKADLHKLKWKTDANDN